MGACDLLVEVRKRGSVRGRTPDPIGRVVLWFVVLWFLADEYLDLKNKGGMEVGVSSRT